MSIRKLCILILAILLLPSMVLGVSERTISSNTTIDVAYDNVSRIDLTGEVKGDVEVKAISDEEEFIVANHSGKKTLSQGFETISLDNTSDALEYENVSVNNECLETCQLDKKAISSVTFEVDGELYVENLSFEQEKQKQSTLSTEKPSPIEKVSVGSNVTWKLETNKSKVTLPENILSINISRNEQRINPGQVNLVQNNQGLGTASQQTLSDIVEQSNQFEQQRRQAIQQRNNPSGLSTQTTIDLGNERSQNITISIPSQGRKVIEYKTEAPQVIVEDSASGKDITVTSETSYTNISASLDLDENVTPDQVDLYKVENGNRNLVEDVDYVLNNQFLVDKVEWVVPHLSNQEYELVTQSGTAPDCTGWWDGQTQPYEISNISDLQCMNVSLSSEYVLVDDIDAIETRNWNGGNGFAPVGSDSNPFTGSLDGQGYKIIDLNISRAGEDILVGLFGEADSASIKNISMIEGRVKGDNNIGMLIGLISGSSVIEEVNVAGDILTTSTSVTDYNYGGLIGSSYSPSSFIVNASFANVSVDGWNNAGGLIGTLRNGGLITNSYTMGTVNGNTDEGGLVGVVDGGSVKNSYSTATSNNGLTGKINSGSVNNSFWDINTSGTSTSAGGTGKTTSELQDISTFNDTSTTGLSESWDISLNASYRGETWFIENGSDYPRLGFEFEGPILPIVSSFDGSTTNFDNVGNLYNSSVVIERSSAGLVNWSNALNVSNRDFDSYVNISDNRIEVNSSALGDGYDSHAEIKFYNISLNNPTVLRDGSECSSCNVTSYSGGTVTAEVPGFSVYTLSEGNNAPSIDDALIGSHLRPDTRYWDKLVGYWQFEGNPSDSTGNNGGSIGDGVFNTSEGRIGNAYNFTNSSEFVSYYVYNALKPFTISFWMKPKDVDNSIVHRNTEGYCYATDGGFRMSTDLRLNGKTGDGTSISQDFPDPPAKEWSHVTLAFNGSQAFMYLNGDHHGNFTIDDFGNLFGNVFIGGNDAPCGNSNNFEGSADEVMFFKEALPQKRVESIYNRTRGKYGFTESNIGTAPLNATDQDGDNLTINYDWKQNNQSIARLNTPFDINTSGIVKDYSDYENNPTLGGGNTTQKPSWKKNCVKGGCYDFDGADDYLNTTTNATETYTVTGWIRPQELNRYQAMASRGNADNNTRNFWIGIDSTGSRAQMSIQVDGGSYKSTSGGSLSANKWYYVAGVSTGSKLQLYVNASVVDTQAFSGNIEKSDNITWIGGAEGNDNHFNGSIDDVRVYDRALSQEQINQTYNNGIPKYNRIISNETKKNETWSASITATDSEDTSNTVRTRQVEIQNTEPELTKIKLNATSNTNSTLTNLTAEPTNYNDPDNDEGSFAFDWRVNGESRALVNTPLTDSSSNSTRATDYSTNNFHLYNDTPVTYNESLGLNSAGSYDFDGNTKLSTSPSSRFNTNNFTFMAWVKSSDVSRSSNIVGTGVPAVGDCTTEEAGWLLYTYDELFRFWNCPSGGMAQGIYGTEKLQNNTWYHLALRFNEDGQVYYYLNGTLDDPQASGSDLYYNNATPDLTIGNVTGPGEFAPSFDGEMNYVRYYDKVLSEKQIQQHYERTKDELNTSKLVSEETKIGETYSTGVVGSDGSLSTDLVRSNSVQIKSLGSLNSTLLTAPTSINRTYSKEFTANTTCSNSNCGNVTTKLYEDFDNDTINNATVTTTGSLHNDGFTQSDLTTKDCSQGSCSDSNSWEVGFDNADPANTQIDWTFNISDEFSGSSIEKLDVFGAGCWHGGSSRSCDGSDDAEFASSSSDQLEILIQKTNGDWSSIGTYQITPGGNSGSGPGADYQEYSLSSDIDGDYIQNNTVKVRYNITGATSGVSFDVIGVYDVVKLSLEGPIGSVNATPFQASTTSNTCGSMTAGTSCQSTWNLTATGTAGKERDIFVDATNQEDAIQSKTSQRTTVNISSIAPAYTSFNGSTTNYSSISDLSNVSQATLENSNYGKVVWKQVVDVRNQDFDSHVRMGDDWVFVNDSALDSSLNSSANVTIYGDFLNPVIYKDGVECTSCTQLSLNSSAITFNTTSFSNLSVQNGSVNNAPTIDNSLSGAHLRTPYSDYWNDMLGYWQFEQNASDSAGYSSSGETIGVTNTSEGRVANAYAFDGDGDYVKIPDSTVWDLPPAFNLTVNAWVKTPNNFNCGMNSDNKVAVGYRVGTPQWWVGCDESTNHVRWSVRGSNNNINEIVGSSDINDGEWHLITGRYSAKDDETAIYVDGQLETNQSLDITGDLSGNAPVCIGSYGSSCTEFSTAEWNGSIDEVAVFNRSLSQEEISTLYNETRGAKDYTSNDLGVAPENVSDSNGDNTTNIVDWRRDNQSIAVLNMPFDTNVSTNTSNAVRDYSTYENNGTLGTGNRKPTWEQSCVRGGCYEFDGNSTVNIGETGMDGDGSFTIEAWLKKPNQKSSKILGYDASGTKYFTLQYNTLFGGYYLLANSNAYGFGSPSNLQEWHQIVIARENNGTVKQYLNGQQVEKDSLSAYTVNDDFFIGDTFNGSIDEVRVYNRTLSKDQIKRLYYNASPKYNEVVSNETEKGETWKAAVTATDGKDTSNTSISSKITIQNSGPTHDTPVLNATDNPKNTTDANLTVYAQNLTDPDEDNVSTVYDWRESGVSTAIVNMPFNTNITTNATEAIRDYSTYQNNGTLGKTNQSKKPKWKDSCTDGGCYKFDGDDDVISISEAPRISTSGSQFISAWIKHQDNNDTNFEDRGVVWIDKDTKEQFSFTVRNDGTVMIFTSGGNTGSGASIAVDDNSWHHVGLLFDQKNGNVRIYVDGELDYEDTSYADNSAVTNPRIGIGGDPVDDEGYYNGSIDQVRIYNRSISEEQIKQIYKEGNESLNDNQDNSTTLVSNETSLNNNYTVAVTPSDGEAVGKTKMTNPITVRTPILDETAVGGPSSWGWSQSQGSNVTMVGGPTNWTWQERGESPGRVREGDPTNWTWVKE